MRWLFAVVASLPLAACLPEPDAAPETWVVRVGVPAQQLPWSALADAPALADASADERAAFLERRPRVVVDVGFGSIAASLRAGEDPEQLTIDGYFDDGGELLSITSHAPGAASGLDHDLSFRVRLEDDDGQLAAHWIGVALDGDPGCGGDPLPRSVQVFDDDRAPLDYDGEGLTIAGVRVAMVIPERVCAVAEAD
ncbi:MAG: hypothetical protein R3A51_16770 [Nannocystaceae bacterium]|nr:hypothetical protein [Myxococcales bacterium]